MTDCRARLDIPGDGTYYCTLSKGEHGSSHKAQDTSLRTVREWPGEFQGD